jgi:hypothetical protein
MQPVQLLHSANDFATLKEGLQTSLRAPQDQGVDIMRSFVRIHRFQIAHMTHDLEIL